MKLTVSELKRRMEDIYSDPYSEKCIKRKLEDIEDIITTEIGKEKIITTKMSASKVLSNFQRKKTSNMSENEWKKEIIQIAAA